MATLEACSNTPERDPRNPSSNHEDGNMATVEELIPVYLRERVALGELAHKTARTARCTLYQFSDYVGRRRIENIGVVHVRGWLISVEHLAESSRRTSLSTVRAFFKWAVTNRHCRRNPAIEVKGPPQPRTIPRALSAAAFTQILAHCPDSRAQLIVVLMVQQGLRCIEVSRLTVGDIDFNADTMRISGKGGHERILPIMPETLGALDRYLTDQPAVAGPLVRSYSRCHRSLCPSVISRLVSGWMRDAGVKRRKHDGVSAHAGRHSCATHMLIGGAHLRDVQAVLGHAHLTTTERYLPYLVNGLGDAMGGRTYGS